MATASKISPTALNVSLAAAHGITPRTVATWYPYLMRTPRVLVPMELNVLMVRDANQSWAATGMTAPLKADGTGGNTVDADSLLPPLFSELSSPRPRGSYLQWYLPRAFTSGVADDPTNKLTFPPIPDRWLVLRISAGRSRARRGVRGWVLEAGDEPPKSFDVRTWVESGATPEVVNPLTALGHGDLAWAGYFDNGNGRLGFQDNTLDQDRVAGPLAYLVCGWFSDPVLDPLGNQAIKSRAAFNAKMQQLGWVLDDNDFAESSSRSLGYIEIARQTGLQTKLSPAFAATAANASNNVLAPGLPWWPQGCLLHGAVVGIDWPGTADTVEAGGPPAATSVSVAIGNTMAETMAAIVSAANGKPDEAQIVEALQLGVIKELDQPDGRAQLDVQVHTESFISISGGDSVPEPISIAPSGPPKAPPLNPAVPGPGIFAKHTGLLGGKFGEVLGGQLTEKAAHSIGSLGTTQGASHTALAESLLVKGGLQEVIASIQAGVTLPKSDPGGVFTAYRSQPRFYSPKDPLILIQGGKRAFTHDSTVKTENGMIVCRTVPVTELSWQMPDTNVRFSVRGEDILEGSVDNGSVPPECDILLRETAVLDRGSSNAIAVYAASAAAGASFDLHAAQQNIQVEQTAWYSLRKPGIDHGPLLANSGITGVLPASFAVAPASRPWTPLQLQWSGEFLPSPNGEKDWMLDEIDYVLNRAAPIPAPGTGVAVQGRATLTGGASQVLASALANAIKQAASISGTGPIPQGKIEAHYSEMAQLLTSKYASYIVGGSNSGNAQSNTDTSMTDIATALSQMDVLSCGLDDLLTQLRGGLPGDGHSLPKDGKTPDPFVAMRAGFLRIRRLRLIDGFGQYLDLCGSSATQDAQGLLISLPLEVSGQPSLAGLPPRFSAPTRAWFRYISATQDGVEADYQTSPLCGFLMPNHLEGSLEFFNADGSGAGSLIPSPTSLPSSSTGTTTDSVSVIWQAAPGLATGAGQDPASTLSNPHATALARSLVDWGLADTAQAREPVLSALLRTIDSTLWSVDPFGHQ